MTPTQELSRVALLARAQAFVEKEKPHLEYQTRTAVAELAAEFAEGEMGAKWLPIETAPKDGRSILLCRAGYEPGSGSWYASQWITVMPEDFETDEQFQEHLSGTEYKPTHWMPLPDPPQA